MLRRIGSGATRPTNKRYTQPTVADIAYAEGLAKGMDKKTAAKQAQAATGLSLITGQRMKTKGFGWQAPIIKTPVL